MLPKKVLTSMPPLASCLQYRIHSELQRPFCDHKVILRMKRGAEQDVIILILNCLAIWGTVLCVTVFVLAAKCNF